MDYWKTVKYSTFTRSRFTRTLYKEIEKIIILSDKFSVAHIEADEAEQYLIDFKVELTDKLDRFKTDTNKTGRGVISIESPIKGNSPIFGQFPFIEGQRARGNYADRFAIEILTEKYETHIKGLKKDVTWWRDESQEHRASEAKKRDINLVVPDKLYKKASDVKYAGGFVDWYREIPFAFPRIDLNQARYAAIASKAMIDYLTEGDVSDFLISDMLDTVKGTNPYSTINRSNFVQWSPLWRTITKLFIEHTYMFPTSGGEGVSFTFDDTRLNYHDEMLSDEGRKNVHLINRFRRYKIPPFIAHQIDKTVKNNLEYIDDLLGA